MPPKFEHYENTNMYSPHAMNEIVNILQNYMEQTCYSWNCKILYKNYMMQKI